MMGQYSFAEDLHLNKGIFQECARIGIILNIFIHASHMGIGVCACGGRGENKEKKGGAT